MEGTIRDIYAQDLGWFDGNVMTLHRESPVQQSQRIADLVGGAGVLFGKAKNALKGGDALGAAQLAQHVIRLQPDNKEAKILMSDALYIVGEATFNAPVRNMTLSTANRYKRLANEE